MKNYTKEEIKMAIRTAYQYLYSANNILFGKSPRLDKRYRLNKLALNYILMLRKNVNKEEVVRKRKVRRNNGFIFTNVLSNPITKDCMKNKGHINIYVDRISEGSRNHWAKNNFDMAILKVLYKYRNKYNQKTA